MLLEVDRLKSDSNSTVGVMCVDGLFECGTCEDEHRDVKVKHETRIPAGYYEIKFREVLSGMTQKYRDKHDWFEWHLELQDVPNFTNVYIHIGNSEKDSSGCILVGAYPDFKELKVWSSTNTFKALYLKVSKALKSGESVYIKINDKDR